MSLLDLLKVVMPLVDLFKVVILLVDFFQGDNVAGRTFFESVNVYLFQSGDITGRPF
jgi:hypothetical protein